MQSSQCSIVSRAISRAYWQGQTCADVHPTPSDTTTAPVQISLKSSHSSLCSCQAPESLICGNVEPNIANGLVGRKAATSWCVHGRGAQADAPDFNQESCSIVAAETGAKVAL